MSKLEKFLTKDEISSLKNMQKSIYENQIIVTCVGLYNHGKSTLLNVLIKDFEYTTFKTADARETIINKAVLYNNIKYVDTPGLNAQEDDDEKVMKVVENSDITLFVHNVNTGEFNKAEINFLQQIQKHWKNPKEFIERTIFVLSRIDESNDKEIYEAIIDLSSENKPIDLVTVHDVLKSKEKLDFVDKYSLLLSKYLIPLDRILKESWKEG